MPISTVCTFIEESPRAAYFLITKVQMPQHSSSQHCEIEIDFRQGELDVRFVDETGCSNCEPVENVSFPRLEAKEATSVNISLKQEVRDQRARGTFPKTIPANRADRVLWDCNPRVPHVRVHPPPTKPCMVCTYTHARTPPSDCTEPAAWPCGIHTPRAIQPFQN